MIVKYDTSLLKEFNKNPRQIYLFGTDGVIKQYISYVKLLKKFDINPAAIVSNDRNKVGEEVLETEIVSYQQFKEKTQHKEIYILLSSSADRYRKKDLEKLCVWGGV